MKSILLIILFSGCLGFSQQRTNDPLPIISQNNGKLTTAQGWLKNSSGQWISRKNKIIEDLGEYTKQLENYAEHSIGESNFIYFELKKVNLKGISYDLLVKKSKSGYYTYPAIQEDWNNEIICSYYIFQSDELEQIKKVKSDSLSTIYLDVKHRGFIGFVNDKTNINNSISKDIIKQIKSENNINASLSSVLALNLYYNAKVVQFYFYDRNRYDSGSISTGNDYKDRYYETDVLNFNKFIKLN